MTAHGSRGAGRLRITGVLPVILLQFAAMTILAAILGTWQDEEYTLATTAHGVAYAFSRSISFELQAPLYFCLLAALRLLNSSPLFARMFSVLAACGVTFVAARIAQRVWPQRSPRAFALLVAFNPFVVYAAVEIRLYALTLLVSAALWLAFDAGYMRDGRPDTRARIATVVLALAGAYLQYFLVFQLVASAIALLVARRRKAFVAYVAAMVLVAILFLPMALKIRSQMSGAFSVAASRSGDGRVLVHPFLDFMLPLAYEGIAGPLRHVITFALVAVVVGLFVMGRPRLDRRTASIVTIAFGIEAIYLFIADVMHYELSPPRHFVALFVPEVVAVYAVIARFRGSWAARSAAGLALIIGLASVASVVTDFRALAKHGDWPRVGAMLSATARPGDVIAVFPADGALPLSRFYHGPARIVPFPRAQPADRYDVDALLVHSQKDASLALARLPQNGRLWFVFYGPCSRSDFYGCLELQSAIAARYRAVEGRTFFENSVTRLIPRLP